MKESSGRWPEGNGLGDAHKRWMRCSVNKSVPNSWHGMKRWVFFPLYSINPAIEPNLVLVLPTVSFPCCHYPVAQPSGNRSVCLPSKKSTEATVIKAGTGKGQNIPYTQRGKSKLSNRHIIYEGDDHCHWLQGKFVSST